MGYDLSQFQVAACSGLSGMIFHIRVIMQKLAKIKHNDQISLKTRSSLAMAFDWIFYLKL